MKVIVRCANNRATKADMEREIERLFQENKDLRLSESHLRDELNLISQQSETRRQKMVEKDKEIDRMRAKIAEVCADRDNFEASYKQVLQWWEEAQSKAVKAEAAADEYRIAAMESDCRVDECEKRMDWLSKEALDWKATAEGYKNQYEELKAQKEADDKKCEETCAACNELYEDVLAERNRLRSEIALLTAERDTSVSENSELIFTINELQDKWEAEHNLRVEAEKKLEAEQDQTKHWHKKYDNLKENYDELIQLHREWGEEIDRLRKVVIDLQTNRFTTDEFIGMLVKNFMPSADE